MLILMAVLTAGTWSSVAVATIIYRNNKYLKPVDNVCVLFLLCQHMRNGISQKQKNRRYLMFITSDNIKQHDLIKLLEIEHQIVSQEIKGSKVDAVLTKSQTQTLDNVVSKMMGPYLGELIVDILKRFRAATNIAPRHLVLYFSGISEGRWSMVASTYIQVIKNGIRSLSPNYKPLITVLTVSKDHNERIYKAIISGNRASEQNIPPGTFIDTKIVSPVINEFYLNAHSAFQIPVDVIEGMTHGLCYLHQIITATVSLPVPLIVADRCAKRGHNIYIANSRQRDPVGSIEEANMRLVNHGPLQKVR
ncbi:unnamed protein product [Cylicocyclus nassatus]|uniref:Piwi domain-containing protein n=1 Tax=Cylicocyclus nassatus TaxID=53992 RepID=A0AA36M3A5_CYLNA|nr:unnamed protein product [Cylicocyclus nassatus]